MNTSLHFVRTAALRAALAAALACAFAPSPAEAQQVTSLYMQSDPGDWVGAGQTYFFTPADGTFDAYRNYDGGVSLSFHSFDWTSHWFYLDFAGPDAAALTPGVYTGAMRFPFQDPGAPGLAIYGDGRGCNTDTGTFEVKEIAYGYGDEVLAFRATFEQHCEGGTPALRGEVRYNASVPVAVAAPATLTLPEGSTAAFTVTATEETGALVALSATGLPSGATFVDNRDNTGSFTWSAPAGSAGTYRLAFLADNGLGATDTAYTVLTVVPPPPPNDERAGAVAVTGVPFTYVEDTTAATSSPTDPYCYGNSHSVWFVFKPTQDVAIEANTLGTTYDATLAVYAEGPYGLQQLSCTISGGAQARVKLSAKAGTTYYFVVGTWAYDEAGLLTFNVAPAPPALSVALVLLRSGDVSLTSGTATVNGTIVCSRPTYASVSGQITQARPGGAQPSGYFWTSVLCEGYTPWSASVQSPPALFRGRAVSMFTGGPAKVSATAWAYDFEWSEYAQSSTAGKILLRGGR